MDIRRYEPDVTRPQFYYPIYLGSIALTHSVFKSLIDNQAKISELLEQYNGGCVMATVADSYSLTDANASGHAETAAPPPPTPALIDSVVADQDLFEVIA